ncbi:MAG: hypothetical protein HZA93_19445 [Verrucomicrobia bacterium]|nr:hypothetical protein [Verrucomicrobiota bacterium]
MLAIAGGLVLNTGVQTWAARRVLAAQPGLGANLDQLSAGFQTVRLKGLRLERDGAILLLPSLEAELSVIEAGLNRKVAIRRLVAKGWTLDLRGFRFPANPKRTVLQPAGGARSLSLLTSAYAADPAVGLPAVGPLFEGVFGPSALPFDLALDGIELAGDLLLPPAPGVEAGRAQVVLAGGGFGGGREGALSFKVTVTVAGGNAPVSSLDIAGRLAATMDTPRTFVRLGTKADAAATGPQFPTGVKLAADISAVRDPAGENYALVLTGDSRQLASFHATFPKATRKLAGTWRLDMRDADLSPFTLGRPLPSFAATGEGRFDTDPAFGEVRATGKIDAAADRLNVVQAELAALGAVQLRAEFDLAQRGDALRVERLSAGLAAPQPVARVQALQTFEFNLKTRQLKVADPTKELLGLVLDGLPLAWIKPWAKDMTVSGGDLRGEFAATARNDGLTLRAKAPLRATGVSFARAGQPVLSGVDVSVLATADYAPQGWQAEVSPLVLRIGDAGLLTVDARVGQLAGGDQPLKAAGRFTAALPALCAQPLAQGAVTLSGGEVSGTFATETLGQRHAVHATVAVTALAAPPTLTTEKLPSLSAEIRADVAAGGLTTINLPLVIEREGRKSDLTLAGTLTPRKDGLALNAQVSSASLVVDDARILAAPFASPGQPKTPGPPAGPTAASATPPWVGLSGQLTLVLKKVVYAGTMQATDVAGTIRIDAGTFKVVNGRAGLGGGSDAKISGGVSFDARSSTPFSLEAEVAVSEFDPTPLFLTLNPTQPATVEGRFNVASKIAGRAASIGELAEQSHGDFQLTSKGGMFRGLPVSYAAKAESTGKIAAGVALLGSALGAVTGKKDYTEIASRAQAVSEITKLLASIHYDQLSVVLARDASLNTVVKDFTLISPELRLIGAGQATHRAGGSLLDDAIALEFKLRARGHAAELLKYLGKLDPQTDELGYAACTLPLKVGGTLAKVDPSELNSALATLAVEKSGARDLFNKLIPGSGK